MPAPDQTTMPVPNQPVAPNATISAPGSPVQPWDQTVTTPTPAPVANATPGLLGQTAGAAVSTTDPALLSKQVQTVTDPNSPIMQRATAIANEAGNDKGLLNSSMAVGAAQNAVLNAAVPIASGDVNAMNTVGMANTQAKNTEALQTAQQKNAMNTAQAQLTSQANLQNAGAENTQIMAQLGQANQVQLGQLQNQYSSFLQTNANASTLYSNTLQQIGQIQNNPNLDGPHKSVAIEQLMNYLNAGLSMMSATSGLNLGAGLNFSNTTAPAGSTTNPTPAGSTTTPTPTSNTPGLNTPPATGLLGNVTTGPVQSNTAAAQQTYQQQLAAWNQQYAALTHNPHPSNGGYVNPALKPWLASHPKPQPPA
jgi:hypothetical protein